MMDLFAATDPHDPAGRVRNPVPAGWRSQAEFSECRRYRYRLERRASLPAGTGYLLWVLCNPSVADIYVDDPTLTRVRGFTVREGYGWYVVVNLFGYRATKPGDLLAAEDPIGPGNLDAIIDALAAKRCAGAIAGWGEATPRRLREQAAATVGQIARVATATGTPLRCLGRSKGGAPRHPLFVRADEPLTPFL